ncbi:MAG: TraR/DksA family transcriptional regulator [Simkaniaceae bacterium]|nr:TraR/DksA family transcriptional regulator [Simkaniaceae bacterium]
MKKADLEKYKKRLLELKAEIEGVIKETADLVKETDDSKGYSQHSADEGTDDYVQSLSIQVSDTEQEILHQVDRALEKIEDGTYGVCDVSGDKIPVKRLDAVPYATMTVDAQDKKEKGLI